MAYILGNFGAILAATLAGLFVGLVYALLEQENAGLLRRPIWLVVAVAAEFWLASILAGALILAPNGASRWVMAIGSAVVIWIGFLLPVLLVSYGFRRHGTGATVGDSLHWLCVMVAQAAVLEAIGLVRP